MMTRNVMVLLLSLVLAGTFSVEASLANQKVHKVQKSMKKVGVHSHDGIAQSSKDRDSLEDDNDSDDDDEDDDADDEAEKAPAESANTKLEEELSENMRKQTELKQKLKFLSGKSSQEEINASIGLVTNETQSPALASMLGNMWKELRMFALPEYTEHVNDEIRQLKREELSIASELAAQDKKSDAKPKKDAAEPSDDEPAALSAPTLPPLTNLTKSGNKYGNAKCQCVGIDAIDGNTIVTLKDKSKVNYPADLGARCSAWDLKNHPKCPGEGWCNQKWCYVDPCDCDISVLPKPSIYIPGAQYQGKPLHFSYATCGAQDSYSTEADKKSAKAIEQTCAVSVSHDKWGGENCRCIGIGPQPGKTKVTIDGKLVDFPADTGATCNEWEDKNHPDCQGLDAPEWCSQAWCYVDPCSCKLASPPKTSSYLPGANYQGKPIYYSYATCGGHDDYTTGLKGACVNQKTSESCEKLDKCAWDGKECLGKELVEVCKFQRAASVRMNAFMALLLPFVYVFL